jgi:hypothetical protein
MRRRTDHELAAEKYAGRESASDRAARLAAYREQRAAEKARRKQRPRR